MKSNEFRRLALELPEAVEAAHMGHPDFRVGGKIFATLLPDGLSGMVKLTPEQQGILVEGHPEVFEQVAGGWGRGGATKVNLPRANRTLIRQALAIAWRNHAPRRLLKPER